MDPIRLPTGKRMSLFNEVANCNTLSRFADFDHETIRVYFVVKTMNYIKTLEIDDINYTVPTGPV